MAKTIFEFGRKLITKTKDFGKSLVPPKQPYMANTKQRETITLAREAAFDKQIKTGAAVTTVGGTAAYLMSGDAKIGPVNKPSTPSTPTPSPARTPVASKPTQEIVPWRDRASIAKAKQQASSTPSKSSNGSSSKSMYRKGGKVSVPHIRNSDVRGAFRKAGVGRTTAMQSTKSRYLAGQAKLEDKTQSIAKTPEISKRYELSPKQDGDKLLNTATTLLPKVTTPKVTTPKVTTPKVTKAPKPKRLATDSARGYLAKLNRYEADNKPKKPVAPRGPKPIKKPTEPKRNYLVRLKRWEAGK